MPTSKCGSMGASCRTRWWASKSPVIRAITRWSARAPNRAPLTRMFALGVGAHEIFIVPTATPSPAPVQPVLPVPPPTRTGKPRASRVARTLGWVALAGGGVSTAAGVVSGILALHKRSELDSACHPGCPPAYRDDIDQFRTYRTVSYVTIGVGAAAVLLGGGLLALQPKDGRALSLALPRARGAARRHCVLAACTDDERPQLSLAR